MPKHREDSQLVQKKAVAQEIQLPQVPQELQLASFERCLQTGLDNTS